MRLFTVLFQNNNILNLSLPIPSQTSLLILSTNFGIISKSKTLSLFGSLATASNTALFKSSPTPTIKTWTALLANCSAGCSTSSFARPSVRTTKIREVLGLEKLNDSRCTSDKAFPRSEPANGDLMASIALNISALPLYLSSPKITTGSVLYTITLVRILPSPIRKASMICFVKCNSLWKFPLAFNSILLEPSKRNTKSRLSRHEEEPRSKINVFKLDCNYCNSGILRKI